MDKRLVEHFEVELGHLRKMADEFKQLYPKVAGRLSLGQDPPDPYVERLMEGFAFLAARVQLKLDSEFPRFIQGLLETVYPQYLAPTPAMAIVRFEIDEAEAGLAEGQPLPRGTRLRGLRGRGENTECTFSTAHDVTLLPLRVAEARYYTRDLNELQLPPEVTANREVKAAIRIRLQATAGLTFDKIQLDRLALFLSPGAAGDELPGLLYQQIVGRKSGVLLQSVSRPVKRYGNPLPASQVHRLGFADEEAMLPNTAPGFSGYRLLREFFAFPRRFHFVELAGLNEAAKVCPDSQLDVVILLKAEEKRLENRVDASCFELFCAPAINLFPRDGIRIELKRERSQYHVIPHKVRTVDYEVYQVRKVAGLSAQSGGKVDFHPFYFSPDTGVRGSAYFTTYREPRLLTERERRHGPASNYLGTDVYLSLVQADSSPHYPDLAELDVEALCTNRHLPIQMTTGVGQTDFNWDFSAPIVAVRCLAKTDPLPSDAEGELAWKLIGQLCLNYLSLLDVQTPDPSDGEGAAALRELLRLHVPEDDRRNRALIEALKSACSAPIVRRIQTPANAGVIVFGRGLQITARFDEAACEEADVFLLGAVLEQFFARYVSINSFTETIIATEKNREIMRWTPQMGRRQII